MSVLPEPVAIQKAILQVALGELGRNFPAHFPSEFVQVGEKSLTVVEQEVKVNFGEEHSEILEILQLHGRLAKAVHPLHIRLDAQVIL